MFQMHLLPHVLRSSLIAIAIVCLFLSTDAVAAGKLYKWVDAQGNVSYQDSRPPQNAKVLEETTLSTQASDVAKPTPIVVYTTVNCSPCDSVVAWLTELAIPFEEHSLLNDDIQNQLLSSGQSLIAPTMQVGERFITDANELESTLVDAGLLPDDSNNQTP